MDSFWKYFGEKAEVNMQETGELEVIVKTRKYFHPVAGSLSKHAYRHWKRLCRTALWKTRWSKFERYGNNIIKYRENIVNYLKEIDYV